MAHKVILPPKKNYIPQFLKQRDINSYYSIKQGDNDYVHDNDDTIAIIGWVKISSE